MCFAERYGTSFSIKLEPCTRFWTRFDRISLKVLCVCFSLSTKSLPGGGFVIVCKTLNLPSTMMVKATQDGEKRFEFWQYTSVGSPGLPKEI